MTAPYAPDPSTLVATPERDDLATALDRLRLLGATPDEVDAFAKGWDDFVPGVWDEDIRAEWLVRPDADLIEELAAIRLEYSVGTTTEAEAAARDDARRHAALVQEAAKIISSPVRAVVAWVDGDPARARAVHDLETADGGGDRVTLLRHLDLLLAGDAP